MSSAQRERSEHAELCAAVGERLQAAEAHYAALTERHKGRLHAAHARWGDCMRRRARHAALRVCWLALRLFVSDARLHQDRRVWRELMVQQDESVKSVGSTAFSQPRDSPPRTPALAHHPQQNLLANVGPGSRWPR